MRLTSVDNADSPARRRHGIDLRHQRHASRQHRATKRPSTSCTYSRAASTAPRKPPFTPEGLYPVTGVHTLLVDTSFAQEEQILDFAIQSQIAAGGVDAANPVVVFGWSQSADFSGLTEAGTRRSRCAQR